MNHERFNLRLQSIAGEMIQDLLRLFPEIRTALELLLTRLLSKETVVC